MVATASVRMAATVVMAMVASVGVGDLVSGLAWGMAWAVWATDSVTAIAP